MNLNGSGRSTQVRLCGSSNSQCGYCGGKRAHLVGRNKAESSKSYGLLVSNISCQDYEHLLRHGWRRSGLHLYKPDNWDSCCPALTIRLPVKDFEATKSQKRILKKMTKALQKPVLSGKKPSSKGRKRQKQPSPSEQLVLSSRIAEKLHQWTREGLGHALGQIPETEVWFKPHPSKGNEPTVTLMSTVCAAVAGKSRGKLQRGVLVEQIARFVNQKKRQEEVVANEGPVSLLSVEAHSQSGQLFAKMQVKDESAVPQLERDMETEEIDQDLIQEWLQQRRPQQQQEQQQERKESPYELTVTTLPARVSALHPDVHKLYFLYQQRVHNDPDPAVPQANPDPEGEEDEWGDIDDAWKKRAEAMLGQEYQHLSATQLQAMKSSFSSFFTFLAESPLFDDTHASNGIVPNNPPLTGTLHQQYRIDGELVAVGVVDVLSTGLSSVYAFYDPDFANRVCPLGKYMIMREVEYCRDTLQLPYYYLGYYIESCGKMRYKADYHPSQLLCPKHYRWVDAKSAQERLAKESPERHCCPLYTGSIPQEPTEDDNDTIQNIRLIVGAPNLVTLPMLHSGGQDIVRPLLLDFVEHVGKEVGERCVIRLV